MRPAPFFRRGPIPGGLVAVMAQAGRSPGSIAHELAVDRNTVRAFIETNGLPVGAGRRGAKSGPRAAARRALELMAEGMTQAAAARAAGCAESTVWRARRRACG